MRRRRPQLQVTTFPFLAVLLCTMGSLILLLLVMDRRAKIVARIKAEQAAARAAAADQQQAERRRAEWERQRQALRALLAEQIQQVQHQLGAVQQQTAAVIAKEEELQARGLELEELIQSQRALLAREEAALQGRRLALTQQGEQTAASQLALARMSADLAEMERTLADLKALRQREQHTYSLIPYRGKHGDNRRPIYIECTAIGLIFHPDRQVMGNVAVSPLDVRAEVERRVARMRQIAGKPDEVAYLLMLVRPDGIGNYYRALAALDGMELEFGYEFIDADWVLDFPEDDSAPATQPWMPVGDPRATRPGRGTPPTVAPGVPQESPGAAAGAGGGRPGLGGSVLVLSDTLGQGSLHTQGVAHGSGQPGASLGESGDDGTGLGKGPSSSVLAGSGSGARGTGGGARGTIFGIGGTGTGGFGTGGGIPAMTGSVAGVLPGGNGPGPFGGEPGPGGAERSGTVALAGRSTGGGPGLSSGPDSAPVALDGGGTAGTPSPEFLRTPPLGSRSGVGSSPGSSDQGGEATLPVEQGTGDSSASPSRVAPAGVAAGSGPAGPPSSAPPRLAAPAIVSRPPSTNPATPTTTPQPGPAETRPTNTGATGVAASGHGEPGAEGNALSRLGPPSTEHRPTSPTPVRPGRLFSDRDWTIIVECKADAVVVHPGGQQVAASALPRRATDPNPLQQLVRRMIDRRQALVPAGEPPYRPRLRFLVHPEGLRTYYQAYPALEGLRLPMERQNVEMNEDTK